jgi:hypothetical protein
MDVIMKRFDNSDEVRSFTKGKFEIVHLGGMTLGRAASSQDGNGPSTSDGHSANQL